jgi:hypothetical protein
MIRAVRKLGDAVAPDEPSDEPRPLGGYLALITAYGAALGAVATVIRLTGRRLPDQVALQDLAMITAATHKISRLVTKDAVTSPLRAPLTRFDGAAGAGEVNESVRHRHGLRHAAGELLTCPFCAAVWSATALTTGMVFAPRLTRMVAATATAVTGADFLHLAYDMVKRRAVGPDRGRSGE